MYTILKKHKTYIESGPFLETNECNGSIVAAYKYTNEANFLLLVAQHNPRGLFLNLNALKYEHTAFISSILTVNCIRSLCHQN